MPISSTLNYMASVTLQKMHMEELCISVEMLMETFSHNSSGKNKVSAIKMINDTTVGTMWRLLTLSIT